MVVHPTGQSSNFAPAAKSLLRRDKKGSLRCRERGAGRRTTDSRSRSVAALRSLKPRTPPPCALSWRPVTKPRATIRELAAWSGEHRRTVVRHLVRAGVELRCFGLTDEQARTAVKLYRDGLRWPKSPASSMWLPARFARACCVGGADVVSGSSSAGADHAKDPVHGYYRWSVATLASRACVARVRHASSHRAETGAP